ncbi:hypothetical protein BKA19_3562 [Blastococcus saxobsidens]|uniref:Uncharacterized protein n=1 Tax=Blastococcus saxobsidens TaxID=138336 RepID=A0A4Q7YB73_9ACTN|nr:hypothetical protein BKA19_3562 [Blastococcus saxobsidens]
MEAFLAPLERAVACLGTGKIVVSPGGRATTDKTHVWTLNGGDGLVLRGDAAGCRFLASMHHRILPSDPEKYDVQQGRWRVTTSAYLYEFRTAVTALLGTGVRSEPTAEPLLGRSGKAWLRRSIPLVATHGWVFGPPSIHVEHPPLPANPGPVRPAPAVGGRVDP